MENLEGDLGDLIISWSIEDILDEERYRDKVEPIPETFPSIRHYFKSFVMPLIEETRAELHSSLESLSEAPCAEVLSVHEAKLLTKRQPASCFAYSIDAKDWVIEAGYGNSEAYKPKNNDILILSSSKPESANDFQRYGETYWLACVTGVYALEEDALRSMKNEEGKKIGIVEELQKGLRIKVSKSIEVTNGMGESLYATFLTNVVTNNRIWKALTWGDSIDKMNIIREIICIKKLSTSASCSCDRSDSKTLEISDDLTSFNLNESQKSAVLSSISDVFYESSCPVKIIWGPPGTGKTKTVSTLLWALLKLNCRTITCAPTNVAVLEVCNRLLFLIKECRKQEYAHNLSCPLGDVLLFGNKDRLKVDGDLRDIYLDDRVNQLLQCFVPLTGWRHRLDAMIDLLQDGLKHYNIYLENETEKDLLGFSKFLRKRFYVVAEPFVQCIKSLWTHLPLRYVSKLRSANIFLLLEMLKIFETLLSKNHLFDKDVEELFSESDFDGGGFASANMCAADFEVSTGMCLCKTRKGCLDILKVLHTSLHLPRFLAKDSIKEFCLRGASLYFCTASSSSLLHYVPVDDLDVVVIDEAAQLKECESAIPLQLRGLHHAVFIGDELQLPSLVKSNISMEAGFGRSLFERLVSLGHEKHLLDVQYRMHPAISSFPNAKFYDNQILDGPNVKKSSYGRVYLPGRLYGAFSFININGGREERDEHGKSRKNMVEVAVISKILRSLYKGWSGTGQRLSIGVVSPYAAQVSEISEKIVNKYKDQNDFSVTVKSIDGFQGGEEDVIILSTVRSNSGGSVGFLENLNRTNVALTRARYCLWILGNESTLLQSGTIWEELVLDAKKRGCFFNADEDKNLVKAIVDVKHELDQLDDLLSPDSVLLRNARWKVLFSDDFKKSFAKLKFRQIRSAVMQLLLRLADGWRPKSKVVDFLDSFQLVRQCRVKDLSLVWMVDLAKYETYTQVLRVWDVLPTVDIPKIAKRLESVFTMYDGDYVDHCRAKCLEGKLEVPISWKVEVATNWCNKFRRSGQTVGSLIGDLESSNYMENSKVNDSLLLMKFYALSSGVAKHLLTANDGNEIEIPFEVTDHEKEIIMYPRSAFIMGRSGTGKTTVLTMKLIQKEQQHYISKQGLDEGIIGVQSRNYDVQNGTNDKAHLLRQIFITVSPKLCSAIRNHISRLQSFIKGDKFFNETTSIEMYDVNDGFHDFMDIPDSFIDLPPKHYPLVITFHKFLIMLDGTIGNSFFERFHSSKEVLINTSGVSKSLALQTSIRRKEVNYEHFVTAYWPHFHSQWTKKLDASTVFTQIISHIKGCLWTDTFNGGKILREDYINISDSRQSTLSREQRERIYDIFLDYEHKRLLNGEFDLSDLVTDLHRRLSFDGYLGEKVDFIYIDEVQDLTMRQIGLFKYISRNFLEGFVFAGDTAQTIARGIDFRFQDLRSLFYKEFLSEVISESKMRGKREPCVSEIFHLNHNFRTHDGVLRLAQSVINLVYHFFPLSIDILSPETSLIYGETPVVLESGDDQNAIVTIFGNSGTVGGRGSGFGAEQVILVRDDCEKQKVISKVEKQALVLTIVECKGLEFQDVLLFNFFSSSPLRNHWRVIYNFMKELDLLDLDAPRSFPLFDVSKHNVLCSELKQLYVAITRTRQRLWICDSADDFSKPMFDYWKKIGLVQVRHLDQSLAQAMQVASSAEDWRMRGIKLFNEGNYEMATMCFERAHDSFREKWSRAAGLSANADRILVSNFDTAHTALTQAAEIYETIGKVEAAANCFIKLKEHKKAGIIYLEKCGQSRLNDAGDCFVLAECWPLAAEVYARARCFSKCLFACSRGQLFDLGLSLIEHWKDDLSTEEVDNSQDIEKIKIPFLESSAVHYLELGETHTMMKFVKSFPSIDLIRNFLKAQKLLDELMVVEIESGNYVEATNIARSKGNLLLEAEIYEKAGDFEIASRLVLFYVVMKSLWTPESKGWPLKSFFEKDELVLKAKLLSEQVSSSFYESVCAEIELLSDKTSLSKLFELFNSSLHLNNPRLNIFAARRILDFHLQLNVTEYHWESEMTEVKEHARETMSQHCCSIETLMHFWYSWKEHILNVLCYLQHLEAPTQNEQTTKSVNYMYEEFCLEYFGLRKQDNQNIYAALCAEAFWVNGYGGPVIEYNREFMCMNSVQFTSRAKSYWGSEIVSVGLMVLELLDFLHNFSTKRSMTLFSQGKILIHIFQLSKFLSESDLHVPKNSAMKLQRILSRAKESFFDVIYPFDPKCGFIDDMVSLRDNETAGKILGEIIMENITQKTGKPTHGQVGRVMMILFVTGKLTDELHQKIDAQLDYMVDWKDFLKQLKTYFELGFGWPRLVNSFSVAMQSTFKTSWTKEIDYISPHCFMYLVECLLFLASSWKGCGGYFFTTKLSLFEMLICQRWKGPSGSFLALSDPHFESAAYKSLDFIVGVARVLLWDKSSIKEWFKRSYSRSAFCNISLLATRLVVVICLAHMNSGRYYTIIRDLFLRKEIVSEMPQEFLRKISVGFAHMNNRSQFQRMIAEALDAIGNPLVVVGPENSSSIKRNLNAIFVTPAKIQCREGLIEILFPKKQQIPLDLHDRLDVAQSNSVSNATASTQGDASVMVPSLNLPQKSTDLVERETTENPGDVQKKSKQLWDAIDIMVSENFSDVGSFSSKVGRAQESVTMLDAAVACFSQDKGQTTVDHTLLGEVKCMLDELKCLCNALDLRDKKPEANITLVKEISAKVKAWRPRLEPFLDSLFLWSDQATTEKPVVAEATSNQSKGSKGKNKNKSKQNKKGGKNKGKKWKK